MDAFDIWAGMAIAGLFAALVAFNEAPANAACLDHATAEHCSTLTK